MKIISSLRIPAILLNFTGLYLVKKQLSRKKKEDRDCLYICIKIYIKKFNNLTGGNIMTMFNLIPALAAVDLGDCCGACQGCYGCDGCDGVQSGEDPPDEEGG
jgi:hypothetical protein